MKDDKIVWKLEPNGIFNCALHYKFAISRDARYQSALSLEYSFASKVKYFLAWLEEKANIRDFILHKIRKNLEGCSLYKGPIEFINHLFLD